jgi:hypothetical protein
MPVLKKKNCFRTNAIIICSESKCASHLNYVHLIYKSFRVCSRKGEEERGGQTGLFKLYLLAPQLGE